MTRWIGVPLGLAVVLASCGPSSGPTFEPETRPATPTQTPGDLAAFAAAACVDAYERCVEGVLTMAGAAPGSLVAICDYADGTGDVVILDSEAEAEAECSGDGVIPGSTVVRVVELP